MDFGFLNGTSRRGTDPLSLRVEERADEIFSSAHSLIFEQLILLEGQTDALLEKPNTTENKLKILKLYFIGEVLLCSIFKSARNETDNGRLFLAENQKELNQAENNLNRINFCLKFPNEKKSIKFISEIDLD